MIDVVNASQLSFLPFGRSIKGIEDEQVDIRWYVASCEGGETRSRSRTGDKS